MNKIMNRKVTIKDKGRIGNITYTDDTATVDFFYEFSDGACLATISVPKPGDWEKKTKISAEKRNEILKFVAEQIIEIKSLSCNYKISDNFIEIIQK